MRELGWFLMTTEFLSDGTPFTKQIWCLVAQRGVHCTAPFHAHFAGARGLSSHWEALTVKPPNVLLLPDSSRVCELGQLRSEGLGGKSYMSRCVCKSTQAALAKHAAGKCWGGKYLWRSQSPEVLLD